MEIQSSERPAADAAAMLRERGWRDAAWTCRLLGCSTAKVYELLRTGEIDGLLVRGEPLVEPTSVNARHIREVEEDVRIDQRAREFSSAALREYLAAHEVTGSWELARAEGRPLVSSRRGDPKHWTNHGIQYHLVGISVTDLMAWTGRHRPDLARELPSVKRIVEILASLPGIGELSYITPLDDPGTKGRSTSRRVTRWIKLENPAEWDLRLSETVLDAVSDPTGADVVDAIEDGVSV